MKPVKSAVIGMGLVGRQHANILASMEGAELLVCCDVDESASKLTPEGTTFTTSAEDALDTAGLEAVFVCTPQDSHAPIVQSALELGLAVFCEKPIADTLSAADSIIDTAMRTQSLLCVGHTWRFDSNYVAVAKKVASNAIGTPVQLTVRRYISALEGRTIAGRTTLAVELGVHDFDILRWLCGDANRVYAEASVVGSPDEETQEAVIALIRFKSGAIAAAEFNWMLDPATGRDWDNRLTVIGTNGSAYVELGNPPSVVYSQSGADFVRSDAVQDIHGTPTGNLRLEDEHFVRTVRGTRTWPITLEDARAALAIAVAIDESSATGRPVELRDV